MSARHAKKASLLFYWLPATVLLLGILSGTGFWWLNSLSAHQRRCDALVDTVYEIDRQVSQFHLWLEEHSAAVVTVEEPQAWDGLASATRAGATLESRLQRDDILSIHRQGSEELLAGIRSMQRSLVELNAVAAELRGASGDPERFRALDARFSIVFRQCSQSLRRVGQNLKHNSLSHFASYLKVFRGLFSGWLVLVVVLVGTLLRVEARRLTTASALADSEQKFRTMADSAMDAIVLADGGVVAYWNRAAERMFGRFADEVEGKDLCQLVSPAEGGQVVCHDLWNPARTATAERATELMVRAVDGRVFPVEVSVAPLPLDGREQFIAILRDISERKRSEEALRENETLLRTLIGAMPDFVCFKDATGRWLMTNDFGLTLFGLQGIDYRGKTDTELAEYSDFYRPVFLACQQSDEAAWQRGKFRRDEVVPRPDGSTLTFDVIKVPLFHADRSRKGLVVIGREISQRKAAEEELFASETRYKTLAEASPVGIFHEDEAGHCIFVNRRWHEITGLSPAEARARGWLPAVHVEDRPWVEREWLAATSAETVFRSEYRFQLPDGRVSWVVGQGVALRDGQGRVTGRFGTITDITDRKRVEEQLLLFRHLINQSDDVIFIIDPFTGRLLDVNDKACGRLGYQREELLGKRCLELTVDIQAMQDWEEHVRQVRTSGHLIFEGEYRRRGGGRLPVEVNVNFISQDGHDYLVSLARDISERKKAEAALRDSEEQLRHLSASLFTVQERERQRIAIELHDELGQALAALKMQVGAMQRRLPDGELQSFRRDCDNICEDIRQTIENVRRLSRDLSPVVLDDLGLAAAVKHLVTNFGELYGITVSLSVADINHLLSAEAERHVYRILQEALTNIAKHAQAGEVGVSIAREGVRIRFIVRDNGQGFDLEAVSRTRAMDKGLGLTAMAERVRMLGGSLDIASRPDHGTTIVMTLPIQGS